MSDMLSINEAAAHYHVSTATIRRWIRSGRIRGQLTLGPFGEQWMINADSQVADTRNHAVYTPVEQLVGSNVINDDQALLREAQQALQEAWEAKESLEKEVLALRQQNLNPDILAMRCDLEGSERQRSRMQQEIEVLQTSQEQAWTETRSALRALNEAYQGQETLGRQLQQMQTESDCLRRHLAQRLGVDWRDFSLLQLFLRWDSVGDWHSSSLERSDWSQLRQRQNVTEELDVS